MRTVIGIDPSLTATGVAVYSDDWTWELDTIKPAKHVPRLVNLHDRLWSILLRMHPEVAYIESLPANAMSAGLTGQSQGVVRLALQRLDIPYCEFAPSTVKKAFTGSGKASKDAMMDRCAQLELEPEDDNQADAIGLVVTGLMMGELPVPKGGWRWGK